MSSNIKDAHKHNRVGPIFRAGELASAAVDALEEDNPDKKFNVEDRSAYVRVETDHECVIRRKTMEEILGRPFDMQELEVVLASFSGQIEAEQEYIRFYFATKM
ncbi:MmoB/DmpM family protein [Emcibacter nanhaiensis]|uniref:Monooxygenase n=1 Tax=Emcibacter nanhaiensis TaxID=1505037 RepID=A0A501PLA4_9PROT|nr:MmoB/DmpM family protein [Emcibacter nanhaiensis]TPD60631.1 monooxygenase [Emcibacter nanhaiensis]